MNECTEDALRVDPAHDVADGAVLAGGVEGLEHDQHAVGVLGGETSLILGHQLDAALEELEAVLLLHEVGLVAWVEVLGQRHFRAGGDAERLDELRDAP